MSMSTENRKVCAACGGKCCKHVPGGVYPHQVPAGGIRDLLSGRYVIDWLDGDPRDNHNEFGRGYFIRPATKGAEHRRTDPSWGGVCTFLGPEGCELSEHERPFGCVDLIPGDPSVEGSCRPRMERYSYGCNDKQRCAIAWVERIDELERVAVEAFAARRRQLSLLLPSPANGGNSGPIRL